MSEAAVETTGDLFLNGALRLRQPKRGHRAGHDAILLAAAVPAQSGDVVADFGAGVGAAGLAVATRVSGVKCRLIEIDNDLGDLARANATLNRVDTEVYVLDVTANADLFTRAGLHPDSADVVLMNPPFNDASRHRPSPDSARAIAHVATDDTLSSWIHSARRLLKSSGVLVLIWRADGLAEVLAALDRGFGSVTVLPVHPDSAKPAIRVIVTAIKGGKAPMTICRGFQLKDETGEVSSDAKAVLGGQSIVSIRPDMPQPRK